MTNKITNIHLEQILIGIIVKNNSLFDNISHIIREEMFHNIGHKFLFKIIQELLINGNPANEITMYRPIMEQGNKHGVDMDYLQKIINNSYGENNLLHYTNNLKDLYLKYKLLTLIEDEKKFIQDNYGTEPIEQCIERMEQSFLNMLSGNNNRGIEHVGDLSKNFLKNLKNKKNIGLKTDFVEIDGLIGGFHRGELCILAGRPSMGKTALAANICVNMGRKYGYTVLLFSLEMPADQITMRILSMETGINTFSMKNNNLTTNDFNVMMAKSKLLEKISFYMDDTPMSTVGNIRMKSRRIKRLFGLDMIVIDYLQLMNFDNSNRENRVQEISKITQGLKAIAKELDICVLALSQLSRAVEARDDKRPQLSDLRDSGSIEQDADIVIFIYREEYYLSRKEPKNQSSDDWALWKLNMDENSNIAELLVDKNRNGPIGTIKLGYNPSVSKFYNLHSHSG